MTLSTISTFNVSVTYVTSGGTATSGVDYVHAGGTLTIPAAQTTGTVSIALLDDVTFESNEFFFLNLTGAVSGSVAAGTFATGTVTNCTGVDQDGYCQAADCNDTNFHVNPATVRYRDSDGDGFHDGTTQAQCADPGAVRYTSSELVQIRNTNYVITGGIALWLDAADPRSYSGSTTTWSDMSGSGRNAAKG